jgi:hypothetical protein
MSERFVKSIHTQFHWPEFQQLENWRRAQPEIPSQAAAVRTFVIRGLKASTDVPTNRPPPEISQHK